MHVSYIVILRSHTEHLFLGRPIGCAYTRIIPNYRTPHPVVPRGNAKFMRDVRSAMPRFVQMNVNCVMWATHRVPLYIYPCLLVVCLLNVSIYLSRFETQRKQLVQRISHCVFAREWNYIAAEMSLYSRIVRMGFGKQFNPLGASSTMWLCRTGWVVYNICMLYAFGDTQAIRTLWQIRNSADNELSRIHKTKAFSRNFASELVTDNLHCLCVCVGGQFKEMISLI